MRYHNFIGGDSRAQSVTFDQQHTINLYLERAAGPGATSEAALFPTPGVSQLGTAPNGPGRGHFAMAGREVAVIWSVFWEILSDGTMTNRGSVLMGDLPATISSNGDGGGQLSITSGENEYVFDLATNVLTQIVAQDGKATMGDQLDGYFLALDGATSTLYVSNLLDGLTWDPTQFAQRSSAPDPWKAVNVVGKNIWLLGEQTSSVWFNAGTFPFPFAEHPSGSVIPYGIAAPFSSAELDGALVWLGSSRTGNGMVLRAQGFAPEVISTPALQNAINRYARIDDAIGWAYNDLGHSFYVLSFPTENITWVYDAQTQLWAQRGTWVSEDSIYSVWRPIWGVMAFGEHRVLDAHTGAVYSMGPQFPLDVEERPIRRLRRAPALMDENRRVRYSSFEVDLELGLGTSTGQGTDPQLMMRQSNDGGKTWSSERWVSASKIGTYFARAIWHRCGSGRRRVFEVCMSDPIPWKLSAAYLNISGTAEANQQQQRTA